MKFKVKEWRINSLLTYNDDVEADFIAVNDDGTAIGVEYVVTVKKLGKVPDERKLYTKKEIKKLSSV